VTDGCIFCGYEGDDFDPEHWVPKWLSRTLIPKHGTMVGHVSEDQTIRKKRYFDLTVEHVCRTCNGGWMSDMETRAREAGDVLRLVLGVPEPPLTLEGQTNLATWCFFKAITHELARPNDQTPTYPASMYAEFKRNQRPPVPECSIALGFRTIAATDPHPVFLWSHSQGHMFPAGPRGIGREPGYHTTILIGHLVIDVVGFLRPVHADVDHGEGFVSLWPQLPEEALPWPPATRFSGVVKDELI
jgi:hypothetical protein